MPAEHFTATGDIALTKGLTAITITVDRRVHSVNNQAKGDL